MGRAKFHCTYCDKSFDDSQDARKRHISGRNHRANVKLWYDGFADHEQQKQPAANVVEQQPSSTSSSPWAAAHSLGASSIAQAATDWQQQQLPPSMFPAPPDAFHRRRNRQLAEWG